MTADASGLDVAVGQRLQRLMARHRIAGAQYLLSVGGRVRVEHALGVADAVRGSAVTTATTFNLYSITKPFTAACTVAAAERGAFDLDAPVAVASGEPALASFGTVRDTLLHRAGFPNPLPLRWVHDAAEDAAFDEHAFVAQRLQALRGRTVRRGRAAYSNLGYLALGRAVERATGQPFRHAVQGCLLDKLPRLDGSALGFGIGDPGRHARGLLPRCSALALVLRWLVDARLVDGPAGPWRQIRPHCVNGSAYGGLVGNARGLAAFGHAMLGLGGACGIAREPLLATAPGPGPARTLAWFEGRLQGRRWLAHAGGGLGGYGELRLYPELEVVSVLVSNAPGLRDHRWLDLLDAPGLAAAARERA
ncbi:MAG TPA: serine hydrolase domain-containing protein [Caldimonas sp.]|nr:serine hydrolase domain-containing protein [Caldimonas sp.]